MAVLCEKSIAFLKSKSIENNQMDSNDWLITLHAIKIWNEAMNNTGMSGFVIAKMLWMMKSISNGLKFSLIDR